MMSMTRSTGMWGTVVLQYRYRGTSKLAVAPLARVCYNASMSTDESTTEVVEFVAAVARVQTLADGGIRVTLDLAEDEIVVAAWLMQARADDGTVNVKVARNGAK